MSEQPQPGLALRDMIWGFAISQAIYVAAKLSIFDLLRDGPKTSHEIADAVNAHELSLYRVLRTLTTVNLLAEDADGRFSATALGERLRSDHPQSMRPMSLQLGSPVNWQSWGNLQYTVQSGKPAFDQVNGAPFFQYFQQHAEEGAVFNAAMTSISRGDIPAILAAYDFSAFPKIVDVGGGHGALLRGILERYPQAQGLLFDIPPVVAAAPMLRNSPVEARCEFVGGDMFQSVPAGGNVYLLKSILHDWNDDQCFQILRNCRQTIADDGKLLHIGEVIKPSNEPDFAKWLDLTMLVNLTGRERTEAEFQELFGAAGFKLTRVIRTAGPTIVEGVPA